jgi:Mce-associated membrane protein
MTTKTEKTGTQNQADESAEAPEDTTETKTKETAEIKETPEPKTKVRTNDETGSDAKAEPDKAEPEDKVEPKDKTEDTAGDRDKVGDEADAEDRSSGERRAGWPQRALSGLRRDKLTAVLVLLALLTVSLTAGVQWREADRLSQKVATERQVRTRAAEFGQALLAYKHTDLQTSRTQIQQLTTTDFGKSYDAAFDGLADVIGKYKADATASVRDTYVNEIDGSRAKALVVLDSEVHSTVGVRRVTGTKLLLELIQEKGQWRVSGLVSLEADDESLTKPDGTPASPKTTQSGNPVLPTPKPNKTP